MEWLSEVISGACIVLVAVIESIAASDRKRTKREHEETRQRAELRANESRLSMQMMSATCALSLVCAKKLSGHQTNGDVEDAMKAATEAQNDYNTFIKEVGIGQIARSN